MVDTKPLSEVQAKWEAGIGRAGANYKTGVTNAKNVIEKAIEAEPLFAAKMQDAIAKGSRAKGLAKVTTEQWRAAAQEKGAARIGPGMSAAKGKFNQGIGRVLSTIQGVSLPARTTDPLANVDNRVKPIVKALVDMKEQS